MSPRCINRLEHALWHQTRQYRRAFQNSLYAELCCAKSCSCQVFLRELPFNSKKLYTGKQSKNNFREWKWETLSAGFFTFSGWVETFIFFSARHDDRKNPKHHQVLLLLVKKKETSSLKLYLSKCFLMSPRFESFQLDGASFYVSSLHVSTP